jgi:hypothetical protein
MRYNKTSIQQEEEARMICLNPTFKDLFVRRRMLIISFTAALVTLAICSKSSFLYPFNDWVDANCFFTVGKGMMQGQVVYLDLFEQKGVLLYFLHGLAYLISHTTFIGVFFIEVVAGTTYLYYAAKTTALFVDEKWAYVIVPVLAALVYSSDYFAHGDSAEELCLPLLMVGFYQLMRFFKDSETLTPRALAVCGALAGCVLWIKYTMLGYWLGFMIAVFVALLLKKQIKRAFMACVWFLAGMLAATAPWMIYFAVNGALYDWFHVYFTLNITTYAHTTVFSDMLQTAWDQFYANVSVDIVLTISILLGFLGFSGLRRMLPGIWSKISILLLPALLVLGVYGGGRSYPYYFLAVMGMTVLPGIIVLARMASGAVGRFWRLAVRKKPMASAWWRRALLALGCVAMLTASAWYASANYQYRDFMTVNKQELAQTQFAEIMNRKENPTLLNYGFLDGGFYTAADIVPTVKYFCKLNITLPEMMEVQNTAIQNKTVQFVVMRSDSKGQGGGKNVSKLLADNYELVTQVAQEFENRHFTYSLYQLKES